MSSQYLRSNLRAWEVPTGGQCQYRLRSEPRLRLPLCWCSARLHCPPAICQRRVGVRPLTSLGSAFRPTGTGKESTLVMASHLCFRRAAAVPVNPSITCLFPPEATDGTLTAVYTAVTRPAYLPGHTVRYAPST